MAIATALEYGSFGGANWGVYAVTLDGVTGKAIVIPGSNVLFAVPTRITAPTLGTYGLYNTWAANTVTVYSTHGADVAVVRVLVFFRP